MQILDVFIGYSDWFIDDFMIWGQNISDLFFEVLQMYRFFIKYV